MTIDHMRRDEVRTDQLTGANKTIRNLRIAAAVSAIVLVFFAVSLVLGETKSWIGIVLICALWVPVAFRFSGISKKGLPPQD
ncbi:hypothetical protein GA0115240_16531 [Streptomyces sp. DvalAA-14]|uniref:hypothetical protein n=1 Tax=unclassified Streptomyces TaxID=2593676 RepID=UPI00081B0CBD|nr:MULTISPECIES: hypothetical protein [unclassified Streptomyces]MYS24536.1 hypothetical protein [Streptomyces sp. SID4948]SCE46993.1 hypothetical protein GA0115240_16531 [Streptomyces sp. DvalAA-14]